MNMADLRPQPDFVFPPIATSGRNNPLSPEFRYDPFAEETLVQRESDREFCERMDADQPWSSFICGATGKPDFTPRCVSCGCYERG